MDDTCDGDLIFCGVFILFLYFMTFYFSPNFWIHVHLNHYPPYIFFFGIFSSNITYIQKTKD